jgi:hypothetical protein
MDQNTKTQIVILIAGVLIGGGIYLTNSLLLWNASVSKDRSDVAGGIYIDLSSLESYLIETDREFLANPDEKYIFIQETPLYPDNGLYFAYQRDISTMDRKIARDTFTFYGHLLSAERDRNNIYEIQRQGDLRDLTASDKRRQQILTMSASREVNMSVSLLPALKQELAAAT